MKVYTLLLPVLLVCSGYLGAQSTYLLESGEMTIAGTSTIHDWESDVTELAVSAEFLLEGNTLQAVENLTVTIPVKGIISGRGSTMDNKTYKALLSEAYPTITFALTEVREIANTGQGFTLQLAGKLVVAGIERPVELTVDGSIVDEHRLRFQASRTLDMTDFEIVPPKALFGTLQTGEVVTVHFDIVMANEMGVE